MSVVERHEHAEVGELGHPDDVGANQVGQLAAGDGGDELLVEVVVRARHRLDVDVGMGLARRPG